MRHAIGEKQAADELQEVDVNRQIEHGRTPLLPL
jgi:hypothetical protein